MDPPEIEGLNVYPQRSQSRTAADDIWQQIIVSHPFKQSECLVPLPTFVASPDGRIVVEDVQQQIMVSHPYKHSKRMVPFGTLPLLKILEI